MPLPCPVSLSLNLCIEYQVSRSHCFITNSPTFASVLEDSRNASLEEGNITCREVDRATNHNTGSHLSRLRVMPLFWGIWIRDRDRDRLWAPRLEARSEKRFDEVLLCFNVPCVPMPYRTYALPEAGSAGSTFG